MPPARYIRLTPAQDGTSKHHNFRGFILRSKEIKGGVIIRGEDVERLLSDGSRTLLPAAGSRPGQHDYVAFSPAGGQFVLVQVDGVCDVEEHSHEYNEYCLVLKGRITTWIGDEAIESKPGDLLFEPANVPHRARIEGPYVAIDFFAGPRFQVDDKE